MHAHGVGGTEGDGENLRLPTEIMTGAEIESLTLNSW